MLAWSMPWRVLLAIAILITFANGALADDRSDVCGYVYPVDGYRAVIDGVRIELPKNDRLIVNGRKIAEHHRYDEGSRARPWNDSGNYAEAARTPDDIVILTHWTDCIDYAWARVYVLAPGALRTTSALWSIHDRSWFAQSAAGLTFGSDGLCGKEAKAPAGRAFVYFLGRDATSFEKQERGWEEACAEGVRHNPNNLSFNRLEPVLPPKRK